MGSPQESAKDHHEFTEEELDQMMYLWDEEANYVVHEYLYMKKAWRHEEDTNDSLKEKEEKNLKQKAIDNGGRTEVDLSKGDDNEEEDVIFLDFNTEDVVHVVEFYAPWCPHCLHLRKEYIELAGEVSRRSTGVTVEFHAVSCELFRMICRAYGISGFPVVFGYRMGMDIREKGIELNPVDGLDMSAESIARDLELALANEPKNATMRNFTNSDDRRAFEEEQAQASKQAAKRNREWQSYPSTIDERYHNAAVSLVFVLKNGVYIQKDDVLDDVRALALKDFLELLDWTTPQSWHIRTGMIRDLLDNLPLIVSGYANLEKVVNRHVAVNTGGSLWGGLDRNVAPAAESDSVTALVRNNTRWTKACTHSERALGFTCGLWNIFHISAIGLSLPEHQLYGFLSGYLTSPADVAEIFKRFVAHFFGCEVCRRNFISNYDNCGQNHCERLPDMMPFLQKDETLRLEANVELARWLLEMHNAVNVRLMRESAERETRQITPEEELSAVFPPTTLCPDCWLDENLANYNPRKMVRFLQRWHWPDEEVSHTQFQTTLVRNLVSTSRGHDNEVPSHRSWLPLSAGGLLVLIILWVAALRRKRPSTVRKTV